MRRSSKIFWESIAEDVALKILLAEPLSQDPGGVNFLRCALMGMTMIPGCPSGYQARAADLMSDYLNLLENPGTFVEWNGIAREVHLLLAGYGNCQPEVTHYYVQH